MTGAGEASERFACFGSECVVLVTGDSAERSASEAVAMARRELEAWHVRFSRFLADSELSALNADPRETVAVSPMMARLAQAVRLAGSLSGGLVDATLVREIASAGYDRDSSGLGEPVPLRRALALAPPRAPAAPSRAACWRTVDGDLARGTVTRAPGVMLDSGGVAKGLFADVLAERLAAHTAFAVVCAGDVALGGAVSPPRAVHVESPFDGSVLHTFALARGGVATSGIGRRSWLDEHGAQAHHLLDPSTGRAAFTGVVQATALAPSALEAEVRAKAALLSGPAAAPEWLREGGVIVLDDGSHRVIAPPARATRSSDRSLDQRLNWAASSEPLVASPAL
jgi:thiamine biosynthesis lipoprotein